MLSKIKPHQAFGFLLKLSLTALVVELPVDLQAAPVVSKERSKKPPAPPPEVYLSFERRDPTRPELERLLDAAMRVGVRPGFMGAIINHESAGTWHSHIRPAAPGSSLKITTDGQVRGETGSSAVGIAQYTEPKWLHTMYTFGEEIIRDANLEKTNPAAAATIRAARQKMDEELKRTRQKPDWDAFVGMNRKFASDPLFVRLEDLRSDASPTSGVSGSIPFVALAHDIKDYQRQLTEAGLEINTTNLYVLHHNNLGSLRQILRNPEGVPAVSAAAVQNNGHIFQGKNENGEKERKTGSETYATYRSVVSDAHATVFERRHYGRDFGSSMDTSRIRTVKDPQGNPIQLRSDLIMPRLSMADFQGIWRAPNQPVTDPASLQTTVAALERLGFDFGKQRPTDFKNRRLADALNVFKQQVGLPNPEDGLDTATVRHLQLAVGRVDHYSELQRQQRQQLADTSTALDLRQLGKVVSKLPRNDPLRKEVGEDVRAIKEALANEGLLQRPPKGRPFDGEIDHRLLNALRDFQREKGLADSKGVVDLVTLGLLKKVDYRKLKAEVDGPDPTTRTAQAGEPSRDGAAPAESFNDMATPERVTTAALGASLTVDEPRLSAPAGPSVARAPLSGTIPRHS
jgi:hypothetical protein